MKNLSMGLLTLALCSLILTGCAIFSEYDIKNKLEKAYAARAAAKAAGEYYHSGYWDTPSFERFQESLETWKDAHISELVASWGKPDFIEELGPDYIGENVYTYKYVRETTLAMAGTSDNPSITKSLSCEVSVYVQLDGSVGVIWILDNYDCGESDPWPPRDDPNYPWRNYIYREHV